MFSITFKQLIRIIILAQFIQSVQLFPGRQPYVQAHAHAEISMDTYSYVTRNKLYTSMNSQATYEKDLHS